ncbi:MAG: M14 family metallocarboxypeptidase [Puniceicoccales bacterium]|jgi:hypothetical protein|nr:M14 family metallocarboxypeptidase [Puniceicoccales bacterium]
MPPEKSEIEPETFLRRFVGAAVASGFNVIEYGTAGTYPLLAAELAPPNPKLRLYLSAGIHGDEPAGALALLTLMRQKWFDTALAWHILPMLNPRGIAVRTRETPEGLDLNRDYRDARSLETRAHKAWLSHSAWRYDAALSLHEDWEASGFYLYEMREYSEPDLGRRILQAVEPFASIERASEIDGFPAKNGLLTPHASSSFESVTDWPEQLLLRRDHTLLSYTFETSSRSPIAERVLAQIVAIKTAINLLLTPKIADYYEI